MKSAIVMVLCLALAGTVSAQDAFDLHRAIMHGPVNPADLPVAGPIIKVEVRRSGPYRGDGFLIYSAAADAWPDVWAMGLGQGGGAMQYTTWACVRIGEIHCGGFVQHWRGARGTGAPWLKPADGDILSRNNYGSNWAYDAGRWGDMVNYKARAGDTVWLFLVAGNARAGQDYEHSVQARTNVVAIVYPDGDNGDFEFSNTNQSTPVTTQPAGQPSSPPAVNTTDASTLEWIQRLYQWELQHATVEAEEHRVIQEAIKAVSEQNERIYADESKQHQAQQAVGSGGVNYTEVFKFLGKYVAPAIAALLAGMAATN